MNQFQLWEYYQPKSKHKGDLVLFKESENFYPKNSNGYYVNKIYPDLFWQDNIEGQFISYEFDCKHDDLVNNISYTEQITQIFEKIILGSNHWINFSSLIKLALIC